MPNSIGVVGGQAVNLPVSTPGKITLSTQFLPFLLNFTKRSKNVGAKFFSFFKTFFYKKKSGKIIFCWKMWIFSVQNLIFCQFAPKSCCTIWLSGGGVPAMTKYQLAIPLLRPNSIKKSWFWGVVGQLKVKFCMLSSCWRIDEELKLNKCHGAAKYHCQEVRGLVQCLWLALDPVHP